MVDNFVQNKVVSPFKNDSIDLNLLLSSKDKNYGKHAVKSEAEVTK